MTFTGKLSVQTFLITVKLKCWDRLRQRTGSGGMVGSEWPDCRVLSERERGQDSYRRLSLLLPARSHRQPHTKDRTGQDSAGCRVRTLLEIKIKQRGFLKIFAHFVVGWTQLKAQLNNDNHKKSQEGGNQNLGFKNEGKLICFVGEIVVFIIKDVMTKVFILSNRADRLIWNISLSGQYPSCLASYIQVILTRLICSLLCSAK